MGNNENREVRRSSRDRIIRYVGLALGVIVGGLVGATLARDAAPDNWWPITIAVAAALGGIMFVGAPYVVIGVLSWLRRKFAAVPAIDIVAAGIGLIAGGLLASLLAFPTSLLPNPWGQILPFFVALFVCSLSVYVVVLRKHDLADLVFRRNTPVRPDDRLLLDTSVIIDGRIVDLMRTGLVSMSIAVPRFILGELQGIADSSEPSRRVRGRRGLNTLDQLQRDESVVVEILEVDVDEESTVDNKLIRLAKLAHYCILTGDQNLERIAKLQDVDAVNINTVAQALRPPVIAGEELTIEIVQLGREPEQGIGFLEDGTLIVVENGKQLLGTETDVVITRTLQTGTGRMAFATVKEEVVA